MSNNIGENIKRYRLAKGMTQEQLAGIVGVSNQAVSKWECDGSIPDGLLFVPIAEALGVATDALFGREATYEKDIYSGIVKLIEQTPFEERMQKAREICWQVEKGLFGGVAHEYVPDEIKRKDDSSYVTRNTGFTSISNRQGEPQFFGLFAEPEAGFDVLRQYAGQFRELFEALGDEYVMKSFFHIYSKPHGYTFEKEALARDCGIPGERLDDVMAKLGFAARPKEITINGEKRTVYAANQRHELVGAFVMVTEFFYATGERNRGYNLQANGRNKPYFAK
jgi:transcriptional regulator with XRE-family HTH domain